MTPSSILCTGHSDHLLTHPSDKVAGEAQGDEEALKKLKADLNDGPRAAHVVKLEVKNIAVKDGEKSFAVSA